MTRTLAIDVGTSSVKAAVIVDGAVVASVDHAHPLSSPRPGWVEQDPGDWWDGTVATIARLNRDAALTDLDALAVTGQMQDLICLDGAGRPLRPAILYSDSRAVVEHDELVTRFGDRWSEVVGSAPDASNVAAKWSWLQRHEPDTVSACAVALFGGHSLVVHRLTGAGMCDPTTAASTALSDLVGGTWWGELVDALAIPVPPLQPVTTVHRLQAAAAKTLGLPSGLPVVHANGDAVATTLGLLGTERNRPYAYLGTSGWVAVAASTAQRGGGVVALPGLADDHWVSAAPMPAAGAVLDWARRELLGDVDHARFDALARAQCAAAEGVLFIPHLDGTRALPEATGVLLGVRRTTTSSTVAAAVVEGIAHAVRQLLTTIVPHTDELIVCGGAARSVALRQAIADVIGCTVVEVADEHAALVGATVVAHLALGTAPPPPAGAVSMTTPDDLRQATQARSASLFDELLPTLTPILARIVGLRASAVH